MLLGDNEIVECEAGSFELKLRDKVIVDVNHSEILGRVVKAPWEIPEQELPESARHILRPAGPEDLEKERKMADKEKEAFEFCRDKIKERNLSMRMVKTIYSFDGSRIHFYFISELRVDFRELVRDLSRRFHTRIEMRQIGVRDAAKYVGGFGSCGRELCCSTFLSGFIPVSVKMAKEQNLALNPSKISGACGRLMCCLSYEYELYARLRKGMPRVGKRVQTPKGIGRVMSQDVLNHKLTVQVEGEEKPIVFDSDEVQLKPIP
jgi:cell fate regulator YaaT (PSP1 superfamily)